MIRRRFWRLTSITLTAAWLPTCAASPSIPSSPSDPGRAM